MKPLFAAEAVVLPTPMVQPELNSSNLPVPAASAQHQALVIPTRLAQLDDDAIDKLGADAGVALSNVSKKFLSTVRAADTDVFGTQLNALIAQAKGLDPKKLHSSGVLSRVMNLFGSAKESMLAQVATVESRMDTMVLELNKHSSLHKARVNDFETLYADNFQYYQGLERDVKRGTEWAGELAQLLAQPHGELSVFESQTLADLKRRHQRLEKRIDDLRRGMMLAEQSSVQIREAQDNARGLTTTFSDIVAVAIPAWRLVFTQYLLQMEQKAGADLANNTYDATEEAFRAQAESANRNTETIAKVQQRSIISIDVLQLRHDKLIEAFDTRERIEKEGKARREAELPKMLALEKELATKFIPGYSPGAA